VGQEIDFHNAVGIDARMPRRRVSRSGWFERATAPLSNSTAAETSSAKRPFDAPAGPHVADLARMS